jgi:hypothetical protein
MALDLLINLGPISYIKWYPWSAISQFQTMDHVIPCHRFADHPPRAMELVIFRAIGSPTAPSKLNGFHRARRRVCLKICYTYGMHT